MTDEAFDRYVDSASDPRLVAGIYNYCDRWCERCVFQGRCLLFAQMTRRLDPAAEDSRQSSVAAELRDSLEGAFDVMRVGASRLGLDLTTDPAEQDALLEALAIREARARADPLVVMAQDYATMAARILAVLEPIVRARGDVPAIRAVETVRHLLTRVPTKTFRAIAGASDDDYDPEDVADDAQGSAKIARLVTTESRSAWEVLMERGRAAADGVPVRLAAVLAELDRGLAARFPRAMSFVRPGFDDSMEGTMAN